MSLAPPSTSPLIPGYRLDRYELLCPIADGGMAQVWVARLRGKHGFEKLVAIKSILPKYASDPHFQRMFLDEARIASGIEHTNVAQIFDLGEEHGVLYLAMEWVDGDALGKLHKALQKHGQFIPTGVVLRIVADTCGGLHAAHELRGKDGASLGVVHRDVSPQNILVSARGLAKLIDFGIAKARHRSAGETSTGMLKGKVQYMAPEQALGQPIDRRADIWAIGAILYHLLSGKPPFDADTQIATLHHLTTGKPPPPLPDRVPPQVAAVVMQALSHDPAKRQATAAEVQAALEAAMVSAHLVTSTNEVAAFTEEHLAERATKRREAVDIALAAAEERERVEALLATKRGDGGTLSGIGQPRPPAFEVHRESLRTVPLRTTAPDDPPPAPPSVPTTAAVELESPSEPPPRRGRQPAIIASVAAVGVLVGIVATIALRSPPGPAASPEANAPSPPASLVATIAPPTSPPVPVALSASAATPPPAPQAPPTAEPTATATTPHARPAPAARSSPTPRAAAASAHPTSRTIPKVLDNGF